MDNHGWRGKVGAMDTAEVERFLSEPVFARLATVDADGWPYVVPVWHEWLGGVFHVIARERSAWADHLVHEERCAVTVDEDRDQRKVIAQCRAVVVEEPNVGGAWVEIARRMSLRYLGEHGPDYLEPTLKSPRWLFALEPSRVWTWQGIDWAVRYKT